MMSLFKNTKNLIQELSMREKNIELPSLLCFERKLEPSDALMYAGNWGEDPVMCSDWKMIAITKRQNRSTISAHGTNPEDKAKPNPVSSDDATLPHDRDTLKVSFTLRVVGGVGNPFACNEPSFQTAIHAKIDEFKENALNVLAQRYAYNIANGRFLWRNRVGVEKIVIHVTAKESNVSLKFDANLFSLNDFEKSNDNQELKDLKKIIQQGISAEDKFTLLQIDAYVKMGNGQHIFPSQEMNRNEKGKVLFQLENCAAMHNVKLGNAIRTIDNWYADNAEFPIAIEPFGAVTQRGQAYRKIENDFYTLMLAWLNGKEISDVNKNYVVANLIRGGVFSRKSEK